MFNNSDPLILLIFGIRDENTIQTDKFAAFKIDLEWNETLADPKIKLMPSKKWTYMEKFTRNFLTWIFSLISECELVTECKNVIERQCKEEIEQVTEQLCEDVIETVCT